MRTRTIDGPGYPLVRMPDRFQSENLCGLTREAVATPDETCQRVESSLEELVAGISAENLHDEISTGHPIGKEVL